MYARERSEITEERDCAAMLEQISLQSLDLQSEVPREGGGWDETYDPTSPLIDRMEEIDSTKQGSSKTNVVRIPPKTPKGLGCLQLTGWKRGTVISALIVFLILVINVVTTAVCIVKLRQEDHTSLIAPLIIRDCDSIKKAGVGIHLGINILSTLLLGASNYCMQSISAPTREDVNRAHAKLSWVDIGIPSIRNLRYIQKRRLLVWLILGLSSIPLHLVYNSTFFISAISNLYPIWFANESFAHGAPFDEGLFNKDFLSDVNPWAVQKNILAGNIYENLTRNECIESYARPLMGDRGNLVLIVNTTDLCKSVTLSSITKTPDQSPFECNKPPKTSLYNMFKYNTTFRPPTELGQKEWYHWICDRDESSSYYCSNGGWEREKITNWTHPGVWTVGGFRNVTHCLSEKISGQCQLHVAISLLAAVVILNAIKLITIVIMATTGLINRNPLVTLGDAMVSFIQTPDPVTSTMGLTAVDDVRESNRCKEMYLPCESYSSTRRKRAAVITPARWVIAIAMSFILLVVIFILMRFALSNLDSYGRGTLQGLLELGFGTLTPYNVIKEWKLPLTGEGAIIMTVIIINLPQLLLSFLYLVFNAFVTCMTAAIEWSEYANKPQILRVSFPVKGQRSTFFLQLPYRYSVPMMAVSALLHWLISQSIFLAQVNDRKLWTYKNTNDPLDEGVYETWTTAAYSPMAIIITCVVFILAILSVLALGYMRLRSGMPLAGSCSLVISAACHVPTGTSTALPLKWGAIYHDDPQVIGHSGHCAFSNEDVELPIEGRRYA